MDSDFNRLVSMQPERFSIYHDTIYSDRIIVFEEVEKETFKEYHFEKHSEKLIDREKRKKSLPTKEYKFEEHKIKGVAEHVFLDELEFIGFIPKGIDIETIVIRMFIGENEISKALNTHPVNKFSNDYFSTVKNVVDRYVENQNTLKDKHDFLQNIFSKWDLKDKADFIHKQILFEDRMQGGFPSGYNNPAATYLSKWFIDEYQKYDNEIINTLTLIANKFNIDTKYLEDMTKYYTDSPEWRKYALDLNLISE